MARDTKSVWERLRKMKFRGDNPIVLSQVHFHQYKEAVNVQREERGEEAVEDELSYQGIPVMTHPESVAYTLPSIDTANENPPSQEEVPSEDIQVELSPEHPSDNIPPQQTAEAPMPQLRLRK